MDADITIDQSVNCSRCHRPGAVRENPSGLCLECIAASMQAETSNTVAKLPEHIKDQLIQWAVEGDAYWRQAARLLESMFEDAQAENVRLPKMLMYQHAAACLGQKSSTVRSWSDVYKKVGDALLDEYEDTFRYSHWRAIIPAAKKANKTIEAYAAEIAKTSDNYGGLPIPVDVIIARSGGEPPKTEAELFLEELEAVRSDLALMSKHVDAYDRRLRDAVLILASAAEDLNAHVEKIEERRAKQVTKE